MDDPNARHLELRGHENDIATHDGVGQEEAHPAQQESSAQVLQKLGDVVSTMVTSRPSFSKSSCIGPAFGEKMVNG